MNVFRLLALAALALHLVWILWVLLGWLVTRNRPWRRGLHIGSLGYSLLLEIFSWPCPLTLAEQFFLRRAGLEPYEGGFLLHYLQALIYPDIPPAVLTWAASLVCLSILGVYALRFRRRDGAGW